MIERAPIYVSQIELDDPIPDLDCARGGTPYETAWILIRRSGRPLGSIELEVRDAMISAAALTAAIAEAGLVAPTPAASASATRSGPLPKASVIVPTAMSRVAQLTASLASLAALDYPDYEVILVDNRPSASEPVELPGVRVVREPRPGISAARNAGLAVASGEIVACTDDDVEVDRGWLRSLAERFVADPEIVAVGGLVVPYELESDAQVWFEQSGLGLDRQYAPLVFEYEPGFRVRRTDVNGLHHTHSLFEMGEFGLGSNMGFRTAALRAAGGFDRALGAGTAARGGEDLAAQVELLLQRRKLAYEPSAIVWHKHRDTLAELERQTYGYGAGFTAMLTAITLRRPMIAIGLMAIVPRWLRSLRDPSSAKRVHRAEGYPSHLGRLELRGMLAGPLLYARARRFQRRWSDPAGVHG